METMYNETVCARLEEALEKEEVLSKLADAADLEQFKAILADEGVDLTDEDVAAIMERLDEYKSNDELTEEQLNAVSGGCILCGIALVGSCAVTAYVVFKVGKWIIDRRFK